MSSQPQEAAPARRRGEAGGTQVADTHRVAKCSFLLPSSDVQRYLKMSKNAWFWCPAASGAAELAKTNGRETILKHRGVWILCLPQNNSGKLRHAKTGFGGLLVMKRICYWIRLFPKFETKLKLGISLHSIAAPAWRKFALPGCAHSLSECPGDAPDTARSPQYKLCWWIWSHLNKNGEYTFIFVFSNASGSSNNDGPWPIIFFSRGEV